MKTLLLFLILNPFVLKAQWELISQEDTLIWYKDVQFLNKDTGFVAGVNWNSGVILKTRDGGQNWDTAFFFQHSVHAIHFPSKDIGYAVGGDCNVIKTFDGGSNWTGLPISCAGNGYPLNKVFFLNDDTGFVGFPNTLPQFRKTYDGGLSWEEDPLVKAFRDISFINSQQGYVLMTSTYYKTENSGLIWEWGGTANPVDRWFDQISFQDENNGILAGMGGQGQKYGYDVFNFGVIANTTDGGISWDIKDFPNVHFFNKLLMVNDSIGYIVATPNNSRKYIFKTIDGGASWYPQELVENFQYWPDIFSISCPNDTLCYAVGRNGMIFKTTNGGGDLIGLNISEAKENSTIKIFPNPAENIITFKSGKSINGIIKILDFSGKEMISEQINYKANHQIDISSLPAGLYLVVVENEKGVYREKLVKR